MLSHPRTRLPEVETNTQVKTSSAEPRRHDPRGADVNASEPGRSMATRLLEHTRQGRESTPSTLSQRMLGAVHRNRSKVSDQQPPTSSRSVQHNSNQLNGGNGNASQLVDATRPLHAAPTTCADRLEARISERRKSNQSRRGDDESDDSQPLSVMYTGRRTYPAEAMKKPDPRYSDDLDARSKGVDAISRNHMDVAQAFNRHSSDSHASFNDPAFDPAATKPLPVSFHFQGGSSGPAVPPSNRKTSGRYPSSGDQYRQLAVSLGQIEQVVGGLEVCIGAAVCSTLALAAVRELELLGESTKKIRTSSTTLILAEIGRPQSEIVISLRRLVARAMSVQKRIDTLIACVNNVE